MLTPTLQDKWDRLKAGERVRMTSKQLDDMAAHFSPLDTLEATIYFRHLVSRHDSDQMGTIKTYIAWLNCIPVGVAQ